MLLDEGLEERKKRNSRYKLFLLRTDVLSSQHRESSNMSWKKYEQLASYPWEILAGKVAPEVLSAPKTGGGLHGE
jgi:hypothetical protein